jgi:hypothetical protein
LSSRSSAKDSYWREDAEDTYVLVVDGAQRALINRTEHTAAIGPDRSNLEPFPVPLSRELFSEVENRLAISAVTDIRRLDRQKGDPRRDGATEAASFRAAHPRHTESEHYLQSANRRLTERGDGISTEAARARDHIHTVIAELKDNGGKWTQKAQDRFRAARTALGELKPVAHALEQGAAIDCQRAFACYSHIRQVRAAEEEKSAPAASLDKDTGRERSGKT